MALDMSLSDVKAESRLYYQNEMQLNFWDAELHLSLDNIL